MDLDGDGVLSMYELEYFYTEQVSKMEALGIETMVFEDCLCQVCINDGQCLLNTGLFSAGVFSDPTGVADLIQGCRNPK